MPWKECNTVDLRHQFVRESYESGVPFTELCSAYGISPKTGYKWRHRFESEGRKGLRDRSRRPRTSPRQLEEEQVCRVIRLKHAHRKWGPKKLQILYRESFYEELSLSSIKRILKKAGLVEPRRKRREQTGRITHQVDASTPNDVWTVDFKGWWKLYNGRCEPLSIRDAYSRYILALQGLSKTGTDPVKEVFARVFKEYGLPQVIHSDNGIPFASANGLHGLSRLSVWWLTLGIDLHRSRPGCPQDNGGHERMHLDIRRELQGLIEGGLEEQQPAFDLWRNQFNTLRPHESLQMKRPQDLYSRSPRKYEGAPEEIEYGQGWISRRVHRMGYIKLEGRCIPLSSTLGGWNVGLKYASDCSYQAWFAKLYLGDVNMDTLKLEPARLAGHTISIN